MSDEVQAVQQEQYMSKEDYLEIKASKLNMQNAQLNLQNAQLSDQMLMDIMCKKYDVDPMAGMDVQPDMKIVKKSK